MNTFVPTSYIDLGTAVRFLNSTTSIVVPKDNQQLIAEIFNNMETLPPLPADLDAIMRSVRPQTESVNATETREVVVSVTSEQILTLHETPVVLVDAPGVGKMVKVKSIAFFNDYVTAYTDASESTVYVSYDENGSAVTSVLATGLLTATEDTIQTVGDINPVNAVGGVENKAVVLSTDQAVTGGTSTLRVRVQYEILETE